MGSHKAPRALVIGDGVAGLGAAIVLARAGWRVDCARPRAQRASHRRHAHLTSAEAIAQLQHVTGGPLEGWALGKAAVWDDNGQRDDTARPILSAETLRDSLARRASTAGVLWRDDVRLAAPSGQTDRWHWSIGGRASSADLLVDATGSGHMLGRVPRIEITIEELSGTDRCWSWTGANDGRQEPWLLAAKSARASVVLLRGPDEIVRLTLRDLACPQNSPAPDPLVVLDRLMLGAGAEWLGQIGTIALDPQPLRYDSPIARRSRIAEQGALPPVVQIGDALIQTAPRLGQGIAQIAQQLAALAAAVAGGTPPARLHSALDPLAERRWAGLAINTGLGFGVMGRIAA